MDYEANALYYGDNLAVLRDSIATESVDLIYLDPPFNSQATYNVLFRAPSGDRSQAQIEAFEDTWHWNASAELAFDEVMQGPNSDAAIMLRAMRAALGENDMMAYLAMMAVRLIELYRVLRPKGSLYLHCDPTASHYLKMLLDGIFGPEKFRSEIIWRRVNSTGRGTWRLANNADYILYYVKGGGFTWHQQYISHDENYTERNYRFVDKDGRRYRLDNLKGAGVRSGSSGAPWRGVDPNDSGSHWAIPNAALPASARGLSSQEKLDILDQIGRIYWPPKGKVPAYKRYLDEMPGTPVDTIWDDIGGLQSQSKERLGYPTQKPVALLERIIRTSSNPGDLVLDPFCGCGTTVHAAQKLNRQWIGIDVTHLAISLIERRLKEAFPSGVFDIHGVPKDVGGARDLALRDKYEFQKWITAAVAAQPYKGGKKGMDRGIDGYINFRDADRRPQFGVVSVKGGENITSGMVRDLKGTVEREKAAMGLFLTLNEPTREMTREAATAGFYETGGMRFPKLQILSVADIFDGRRPQVPFGFTEGFRQAAREAVDGQPRLNI